MMSNALIIWGFIMFMSDAILGHIPLVIGTIWSLFGLMLTVLVEMMSHALIFQGFIMFMSDATLGHTTLVIEIV